MYRYILYVEKILYFWFEGCCLLLYKDSSRKYGHIIKNSLFEELLFSFLSDTNSSIDTPEPKSNDWYAFCEWGEFTSAQGRCYREIPGATRHLLIDLVWLFPQSTHRVAMAPFWWTFYHDGKISPAWWGACTPIPFHYIYQITITLSKTTANGARCSEQLCSTFISLYFGVKIVDNYRRRHGIFKL